MKICTIIAEYNPFHNGHLRQLRYVKSTLKPDYVIVIMSGCFTERGDVAILDKYTRASHAILGGADLVLELPQVFASENAEVFSKGALNILSKLPGEKTLCFGAENDNLQDFINLAKILMNETSEYKQLLKENLSSGLSYVLARKHAIIKLYSDSNLDLSLLDHPNNILGLEYVKAILEKGYDFNIEILKRQDNGFNNDKIDGEFSSALSIRKAILDGKTDKITNAVPVFTFKDLPTKLYDANSEILYALHSVNKEQLKQVPDCTEGLENKLKNALKESFSVDELIKNVNTKRYTDARIKRILVNNLLKIDKTFVKKCLKSNLYFRVLAIKKGSEKLLKELNLTTLPVIERKSSLSKLKGTALKCIEKDIFASQLYGIITKRKYGELIMKKI